MSTKRHLANPTQARMAISNSIVFQLVDVREIHRGAASDKSKTPSDL